MFNITGGEIVIILIVALVILGPDRIPELARSAGRMINKVKSFTEGMQSNVSGVMDDPSMKPLKDLTELAARPRQKLAEYALEAEAEEQARKEAAKLAAEEPVAPDEPADDAVTTAEPAAGTAAEPDEATDVAPIDPEVAEPDESTDDAPDEPVEEPVEEPQRSTSGTLES